MMGCADRPGKSNSSCPAFDLRGKRPVLFCDFDGTITSNDNIIEIMKKFAPPAWEQIKDRILAQSISIQEGVGRMFSLLPVTLKDEVVRYVMEHAAIRDGFSEFIQFTKAQELPLYIVSGGIDFFVYPKLAPFGLDGRIYCNGSDFTGETIHITWPHPCDEHCESGDCGCCKTTIMRGFDDSDFHITIGDSITDLRAAKQADYVFARDYLKQKCEEQHIPYTSFETFYDIIGSLEAMLHIGGNEGS